MSESMCVRINACHRAPKQQCCVELFVLARRGCRGLAALFCLLAAERGRGIVSSAVCIGPGGVIPAPEDCDANSRHRFNEHCVGAAALHWHGYFSRQHVATYYVCVCEGVRVPRQSLAAAAAQPRRAGARMPVFAVCVASLLTCRLLQGTVGLRAGGRTGVHPRWSDNQGGTGS